MSEEPRNGWLKQLLKTLGIAAIVLLSLVVLAFGLLVGICGLSR